MQTIGERLEEARKRKGISIREASEATKLRSDYLHKFESNSFDINLPEIYVRGFLKTYSNFLKINSEKILADYNAIAATMEPRNSRRESREVYGRMDLAQAAAPAQRPEGSTEPAPGDSVPSPAVRTRHAFPEPRPSASPGLSPAMVAKTAIIAGVLLVVVLLGWGLKVLLTSEAPAPKSTVQSEPTQTITIIALDKVRVKIVQQMDGKELFQGDMIKNETRQLVKKGPILITASFGERVMIEINGKQYPLPFKGYERASMQ